MIGIVILHFNVLEETRNCLNSFINLLEKKDYFIVVVDNGSSNNSGEILKKEYSPYRNIFFIINAKNLGFSAGNNIGCKYAKNLNPDFLVVVNNDTYINDKFFIDKIYKEYDKSKFDVLGPKIWNLRSNYNQNPYMVISSLDEVNECIREEKRDQKAFKYKYFIFKVIIKKLINLLKKNSRPILEFDPQNLHHGLNGAALIFSRKYIEKYEEIFLEESFIYSEEHFLNYRRIKDNLIFSCNFDIIVYHNESVSTKKVFLNKYKKWKFQYDHQYQNKFKLKKLYEDLEKK